MAVDMKTIMRKMTSIVITVLLMACFAARAGADFEGVDAIIKELDEKVPSPPTVLTVEKCIELALENNPELKKRVAALNAIKGDEMIDRSRFFSHLDFIAGFDRGQGSVLKTVSNYSHNPQAVLSTASPDAAAGFGVSSSGSSSSGIDASALAGVDMDQVSSLASQYGIDISQFLRPSGDYYRAESLRKLERVANQTIPGTGVDVQELQDLVDSLNEINDLLSSSTTTSDRTKAGTKVSLRYSRRLIEWGRDPSSQVGIRKVRRTAISNYEQKLREVIRDVRVDFFTLLLNQQQVNERKKLLEEYKKRHWQQKKRFEIAQDVSRLDVLTAELDVLNEEDSIRRLELSALETKYELMKIIDMPIADDVKLVGELPEFDFTEEEVAELAVKNSYDVQLTEGEVWESERAYQQLAWDYKPIFTANIGLENRRTAAAFTINNSNQTYGLDMGVEQYMNMPASLSTSSSRQDHNYSLSAGVVWNLYDSTQRKGIDKVTLEKLNESREELRNLILQEELDARTAFRNYKETKDKLDMQKAILDIYDKRLNITRKLREYDRVQQFEVDNYRNSYFSQLDNVFKEQENLITAQENLRALMGQFD